MSQIASKLATTFVVELKCLETETKNEIKYFNVILLDNNVFYNYEQ